QPHVLPENASVNGYGGNTGRQARAMYSRRRKLRRSKCEQERRIGVVANVPSGFEVKRITLVLVRGRGRLREDGVERFIGNPTEELPGAEAKRHAGGRLRVIRADRLKQRLPLACSELPNERAEFERLNRSVDSGRLPLAL